MAEIVIPYAPRLWARRYHASLARWSVLVLHRRAGKTTASLAHHVRAAIDDQWETRRLRSLQPDFTDREIKELLRERIYAHVLPTLTQAKAVAWDKLKRIANRFPFAKTNESELSVTFLLKKGHTRRVRLAGADNIDSLRGFPLSGLSMDEFSQHPPGIFGEVLSKSLGDHLGYASFLGTIKGKNQLYQTFQSAKDQADWFSLWQDIDVSLATESGGTIKALAVALEDDRKLVAQGVMTQEEFDQEWYLSPFAAIKGAYYAKQLAQLHKSGQINERVTYDPALPVYDVWDLGKGPNMSVGMFQRFGRQVAMIDYEEGSESDGIPQLISTLKERPYIWGKHFGPHDIKATDLGTGKTREATAAALGWKFEQVPAIPLEDGINALRTSLPRWWINEKTCSKFIEALGQYRRVWNDTTGSFGDKPVHDWASHPADMGRYTAVSEHLMRVDEPPRAKPKPPPVPFSGHTQQNAATSGWQK